MVDERIKIGNILYLVDEEECERYERVDKITDELMITQDGSWYLKTLGTAWHIKEVVRYARQGDEETLRNKIRDILHSVTIDTMSWPDGVDAIIALIAPKQEAQEPMERPNEDIKNVGDSPTLSTRQPDDWRPPFEQWAKKQGYNLSAYHMEGSQLISEVWQAAWNAKQPERESVKDRDMTLLALAVLGSTPDKNTQTPDEVRATELEILRVAKKYDPYAATEIEDGES